MSLFSFRRFFENRSSRSSRTRRKHRNPARRILSLEALEHRLAPATFGNVLPAAIVNSQTALTTAGGNINPQVVIDPIASNKLFEVHSTGGGLSGFFSNDSGASWNVAFTLDNTSLPQ